MNVHIAHFIQVGISPVGGVVNKNDPKTTYRDIIVSSSEQRIAYDLNNASTGDPNAVPRSDFPTLEQYLTREAAIGYKATFVSPSMVITYNG